MKIIGVNGSTRSNGNTQQALEILSELLSKLGHEMEIIELRSLSLHPCKACYWCKGKEKC